MEPTKLTTFKANLKPILLPHDDDIILNNKAGDDDDGCMAAPPPPRHGRHGPAPLWPSASGTSGDAITFETTSELQSPLLRFLEQGRLSLTQPVSPVWMLLPPLQPPPLPTMLREMAASSRTPMVEPQALSLCDWAAAHAYSAHKRPHDHPHYARGRQAGPLTHSSAVCKNS
jgi:hypothetical protein